MANHSLATIITPLLIIMSLNSSTMMATGTEQVIDIFTNYPNTVEVLKDYNRLLESRHHQGREQKQAEAQDNSLATLSNNHVNMATKTRSMLNLYDYNQFDRYYDNYGNGNHGTDGNYGNSGGVNIVNTYWDGLHDLDEVNHNHNLNSGILNNDILESEFGVFEEGNDKNNNNKRKKNKKKYYYGNHNQVLAGSHMGDVTSAPSVGHFVLDDHSGYHDNGYQHQAPYDSETSATNLVNLNNYIGMAVTATRPPFLTTIKHQRRNKTNAGMGVVNDYFDFDISNDEHHKDDDGLESDFGEIVVPSSMQQNGNKNRNGKIKKIPKPNKNNNHNSGNHDTQNKNPDVAASTLKMTNLLRKYLVKMHRNKTTDNYVNHGNRKNRKQSTISAQHSNIDNQINNDRTFSSWLAAVDKNTQVETTVKLHEGHEKFLLGDHYAGPLESIKNKTKQIANKFLSLFTVIQFANFRCQANSAISQYEGTCFLASECAERNGVAMGMCAEGHGVCCVFKGTCGGVGSNNCTYFESPGYPNYFPQNGGVVIPTVSPTTTTGSPLTPDPRLKALYRQGRQSADANALSCIFKVYKTSVDVKQMRIDFIDLELAGPTNGQCINERLVITGTGLTTGVPPICGYNTGQHVYIDVSTLSGPLQLAVLANMIERKRYKLRICQYEDGCSGLMNCLQHYTGRTGVISSFNYDQAATFNRSIPQYFNNLNYAICVRREPGYCSVTYTNIGPNGVVYPFQLRNFDEDGLLTVPQGQAGAGVINCPDDYIVINGIRLCGDRLNDGSLIEDFTANAPVTDTSGGPIIIPVRTNSASTGRGFRLFYTQNPCPTTGGAAGTPDPRI